MFQKYTDIITMFHISHFSNACISSGEQVVTYLYRGIDFISFYNIIPPLIERGLYCNHLVCPSVRPFVRLFTLSLRMSQLLLEEMILFLIHDFGIVTCTVSPLSRFTAHLLPVYSAT